MNYSDIISNLPRLNEGELRDLNRCVIDHLKTVRNIDAAEKRAVLREGDRVSWIGGHGYTEGTIIRVKRKKAICDVGLGRNWDVPLNMLNKVA